MKFINTASVFPYAFFLLISTLVYLIAAFIAFDLNPGNWWALGRAIVIITEFGITATIIAFSITEPTAT